MCLWEVGWEGGGVGDMALAGMEVKWKARWGGEYEGMVSAGTEGRLGAGEVCQGGAPAGMEGHGGEGRESKGDK